MSRRAPDPSGAGARLLIPAGLDATVVLVRHGESTYVAEGRFQGQADPPLSELGRQQARLVAARLSRPAEVPALPLPDGPPLEVVHSPLARAADTARSIAAAWADAGTLGASVARHPDAGFLEIGQGEWEGRPSAEIAERWADELAAWRRDPVANWAPGGESVRDVDRRVRPALATLLDHLAQGRAPGTLDRSQVLGYLAARPDQGWSVVVAHDGVFKLTLLALLDLPIERFWTFPFALCGISIVEIGGGRARLLAHNLTDHLAVLENQDARALAAARRASGAR